MEQRLIGREAELKLLNEYINSDRSEFIAVYGRRRVGKTFLIRKAVEEAQDTITAYTVTPEGLTPFPLTLGDLTKEERQIILDGCLINYNRVK